MDTERGFRRGFTRVSKFQRHRRQFHAGCQLTTPSIALAGRRITQAKGDDIAQTYLLPSGCTGSFEANRLGFADLLEINRKHCQGLGYIANKPVT